VDVQTKNNEDADNAASVGTPLGTITFTNVTSPETKKVTCSACLELVRYRYTLSAESGLEWIHFRANPPIWQPN
jgi:hypothetical protein